MEFTEWLKNRLDKKGWKQADLARESGLDTAVISNLVNGRRGPGMDTYRALARAFDIKLKELFVEIGILEPEPDYDPIYEELARYAYRMTAEERAMYLAYGRVTIEEKEKKGRREK